MAAVPPPLKSLTALLLIVACSAGLQTCLMASSKTRTTSAQPLQTLPAPRRIVSLVPATTEMLFAIGVADRIAGVGSYDRFPREVDLFPRVGGLLDPNVERILSLKPDLVIVYETQTELIRQLERVGIPMFPYVHRGVPDITETMRALGARVGVTAAAETVASRIDRQLSELRVRVVGRPRPTTLLVFGREPGSLRFIDASGGYGFLHDLLEIAGGSNVLSDLKRQSVQMSTEMILGLAPEVIIELQDGAWPRRERLEAEARVWDALLSVPAVRNKRVHLLVGDEFVVPGPRIVLAGKRFAQTLHPDAFAK